MLAIILLFGLVILYFYRKPNVVKIPINEPDLVVRAPCYGRVLSAKYEPKNNTFFIAIFLSPFDIHWQSNPIDGTVTDVVYDPSGKYELAYDLNKSKNNEKAITTYKTIDGQHGLKLVQIAGYFVRRIQTFVKQGQGVKKGDLMGLIHFGSRVDLIIDQGDRFVCEVKQGDSVYGANTVLGRWV